MPNFRLVLLNGTMLHAAEEDHRASYPLPGYATTACGRRHFHHGRAPGLLAAVEGGIPFHRRCTVRSAFTDEIAGALRARRCKHCIRALAKTEATK